MSAVATSTAGGGTGAGFRAVALAYVLDFAMVNCEMIKYIDQMIKKRDDMTNNDVRTWLRAGGPPLIGAAPRRCDEWEESEGAKDVMG